MPWVTLRRALDQGFQLGLFERTLDSGTWPCDLGGAGAVKLKLVTSDVSGSPGPTRHAPATSGTTRAATAHLESHELQELADVIDEILLAAAGHELKLTLTVALEREGGPSKDAVAAVNAVLGKLKEGWTL